MNRLLILIGTVLATSYAVSAGAVLLPRIELLSDVRVAGPRLSLSDFLPDSAPAPFRARAGHIPLGAAPSCGTTRVFDQDTLLHHSGVGPELLSQVLVPDRIVVSCSFRPVTMPEVLAAIKQAMKSKGVEIEALSVGDLLLQSQVFVKPGSSLQVIRTRFDAPLRRVSFLLRSSGSSGDLPFVVTASLDSNIDWAHLEHGAGLEQRPFESKTIAPSRKTEVLVTAGTPARLMLRSASIAMVEDVVPLEPGMFGQQIRVRMLDTGKVSRARVDGRSHLEVRF